MGKVAYDRIPLKDSQNNEDKIHFFLFGGADREKMTMLGRILFRSNTFISEWMNEEVNE